jgi:TRAP-type C4-dicarboxylate transport system substrate-binding protein
LDTKKIFLFSLVSLFFLLYSFSGKIDKREKSDLFFKEKIVFRYINSSFQKQTFYSELSYFAERLRERTQEELLVEIYYKEETEKNLLNDVQMGTLDITKINLLNYKGDDERILKLFEANSKKELWDLLKGDIGKDIKERISQKDNMIVPLGYIVSEDEIPEIYLIVVSRLSWNNLNYTQKTAFKTSMEQTEEFIRNKH